MNVGRPLPLGVGVSAEQMIALRWQVRQFVLKSRRRASSAVSGAHASRFRGRGVDYLESRAYMPGDDIRNMDWRVTARTGKAHTKIYQEERERPIILLLDINPSMFFGTRTRLKSVAMAEIAAALAWATTMQGDRIGALAFWGDQHHEIRPAGGRRGVMRLIRALDQWCDPREHREQQQSGMVEALVRLRRVVKPGSSIIIVSDFYSYEPGCGRQLSRLAAHNDVLGVWLRDPVEMAPLPKSNYPISDGKSRGVLPLQTQRQRQHFSDYLAQRESDIHQLFQERALSLIDIDTSAELVGQLRKIWSGR